MSPDATRGVRADMAVGAELPGLLSLGLGLTVAGALLLAASALILAAAVRGGHAKEATS
jgi:hypothetical protein